MSPETKDKDLLEKNRRTVSESEIDEAVQTALDQESEEGFTVNISCNV